MRVKIDAKLASEPDILEKTAEVLELGYGYWPVAIARWVASFYARNLGIAGLFGAVQSWGRISRR
jgi:hypothetical protein